MVALSRFRQAKADDAARGRCQNHLFARLLRRLRSRRILYKENGIITKVLGDPDHAISRGKLCGKCAIAYNGAWRDPSLRLTSPLRR